MTQQPPTAYGCYRHPDRGTYIHCQRCGRPICGDCMISAAVGFQCPDCVAAGSRETRQNLAPYGGRRSRDPRTTTLVLIALNAAVWLAIALTGGATSLLVDRLALPSIGFCWLPLPGTETLPYSCESLGGGLAAYWAAAGGYWQLFTSAFTHIDVFHLGMNMLALWFLGPTLEATLGRARFLAVYLVSAITASVTVFWFSAPLASTLGASGAVFGLIGALLVLAHKVRGDVRTILLWLGINVAYTFLGPGNISWQGHLGGLLGGALAALVIAYAPRANRVRVQWLTLAGLALVLLASIVIPVQLA